jgi:hypothetical protein
MPRSAGITGKHPDQWAGDVLRDHRSGSAEASWSRFVQPCRRTTEDNRMGCATSSVSTFLPTTTVKASSAQIGVEEERS